MTVTLVLALPTEEEVQGRSEGCKGRCACLPGCCVRACPQILTEAGQPVSAELEEAARSGGRWDGRGRGGGGGYGRGGGGGGGGWGQRRSWGAGGGGGDRWGRGGGGGDRWGRGGGDGGRSGSQEGSRRRGWDEGSAGGDEEGAARGRHSGWGGRVPHADHWEHGGSSGGARRREP